MHLEPCWSCGSDGPCFGDCRRGGLGGYVRADRHVPSGNVRADGHALSGSGGVVSGFDPTLLVSIDTETYKIAAGRLAPRLVCSSIATVKDGKITGALVFGIERSLILIRALLEGREVEEYGAPANSTLLSLNLAFDMGVFAAADASLIPLIFEAYRAGRCYDPGIALALDAICGGYLGLDSRTLEIDYEDDNHRLIGKELRDPVTRKPSRYSLAVCVDLVLGRVDAKVNDAFRTSYALLEGIPPERWPEFARIYPIEDACNTLEVALKQLSGWVRGPLDPYAGPARNLDNLPAQVEAAFAFHLGACHGLRTDRARVEALAAEVEEKHKQVVERFQKLGWIRKDGTEDQAAVKRALALAYGVTGVCPRCRGVGRVCPRKRVPCRGEKVRGRFRGCGISLGQVCATCGGRGELDVPGEESTCRASTGGCDGTGLDLSTTPFLPRTDKGGIKTDRDAAMESGDDDVAEYADNVWAKTKSTYVPYLRKGISRPLWFSPNVLVASGRASLEHSPAHQFSRDGGVRECICARAGCVLCSTDYPSGELITLSQICLWVIGHSRMGEIINRTKDPGALHAYIASKMAGVSFEEALARIKAGDKQMKDYRQTGKVINYGAGGGMGVVKFITSTRKQNAGTTKLPDGTEVPGVRYCILIGKQPRCGIKKKVITPKHGPPSIVCERCLEIVRDLVRPAFFDAYPEVKEYHEWVNGRVEKKLPALCLVWDREKGEVVATRRRGNCGYSDMANNGFQALLADVFKLALTRLTYEAYTGRRWDTGEPSPLYGARFPLPLHDDPLAELHEETAHLAAPRIAEIMSEAGTHLAPDIYWKPPEPALSRVWSKSMESVYDENGKLVVWQPKSV